MELETTPRDTRHYAEHDKARDGTFLRIRAIRPEDRDGLPGSFAGPCEGIVATVWIEGSERIVGWASYVGDPWTEPRRAEGTILVLDEWRGRGIGSILSAHLERFARAAGIDILYAPGRDGLRVPLILRPSAVRRIDFALEPA